MESTIYALVTVAAGGCWLAPSQRVALPGQQVRTFYVALADLVLAGTVAVVRAEALLFG